jgi:hypothetical protein
VLSVSGERTWTQYLFAGGGSIEIVAKNNKSEKIHHKEWGNGPTEH